MKRPHSFHTQAYKRGYIHTHVAADGSDEVKSQIGSDTRVHKTFAGAQRWITKVVNNAQLNLHTRDTVPDEPVLIGNLWLCTWYESDTQLYYAEDFRGVIYSLGCAGSAAPVRSDRSTRPVSEMLETYTDDYHSNGDLKLD